MIPKVFIAGGNGLVGKAVKKSFTENKYNNILSPSKNELNLLDQERTVHWLKHHKPDVIIICAAKVGGIVANKKAPFDFFADNITLQNNILLSLPDIRPKCTIFLGSSCIYPKNSQIPIKEEYLMSGKLEETNEAYAIAKIGGLMLCKFLRKQHNLNCYSLMPTNLYGPGDNYHSVNSHVIPGLIRKIHEAKINQYNTIKCWGSGHPLREFLYSEDLGSAIFKYVDLVLNSSNETFMNEINQKDCINVGSSFEVTIKELVEIIASEINYQGKVEWDQNKPDGTYRKKLDTSFLEKYGWESSTNLKKGISLTYADFLENLQRGTLRER